MIPGADVCDDGSRALVEDMAPGRPYIFIINGRESHVCVDRCGGKYLFGCVTMNKVVMLVDKKGLGKAIIRLVDPGHEQSAIKPGDELFHSEAVVVPILSLRVRVKTDDISIIEDPWRPFLGADVVDQDGNVLDEKRLFEALPKLAGYHVAGVGFVRNPDVWSGTSGPASSPGLRLVQDDSSSSEEIDHG